MRHFCAGVINICTLRHVEYNFFLFGFLLALLVFFSSSLFFACVLKGNEKKLPAVCGILNILYVHYPNRTKRQQQQGNGIGNGKRERGRDRVENFYRSSSSQLRSVLSDWTSAAITRIAMPRCSSTTRWPCPGISRHG